VGRWLKWIGTLVSVAYGGTGIADPGNLDLTLPAADDSAARWVTRVAVLTPLVVVILILIGLAWPIVAVAAAILLLPLVLNRIRALRRP
jgi:uncharacterized membrane protein YphA (DoxX/SURF4 family)